MEIREALKKLEELKKENKIFEIQYFTDYESKFKKYSLRIYDFNFEKCFFDDEDFSLSKLLSKFFKKEITPYENRKHPSNSEFDFDFIFSNDTKKDGNYNELYCKYGIYRKDIYYTFDNENFKTTDDLINFIYEKHDYVEEVLQEDPEFYDYLRKEEATEYYVGACIERDVLNGTWDFY